MLECRSIDVAYGRLQALRAVSLKVEARQVVSIIGANGAGKTTLLRAISGLERCQQGTIALDGRDINHCDPSEIVRRGVSHVPAGAQVFRNMSVIENLRLGAYTRIGKRSETDAVREDLAAVYDLFPALRERSTQPAGTLSGGQQQMLAIGRALMARPRLLLLDEPSLGLAPQVLDGIFAVLRRLNRERGLAILLVEQNAHLALDLATEAYLLDIGNIVGTGATETLRHNEMVARIYLGIGGESGHGETSDLL